MYYYRCLLISYVNCADRSVLCLLLFFIAVIIVIINDICRANLYASNMLSSLHYSHCESQKHPRNFYVVT